MTDWERVRRLRAKGLDWTSIAEDPKVGYTPPSGVSDPGRALKALYLSRRSRAQRPGGGGARREQPPPAESAFQRRERWARPLPILGIAVLLGGFIWLAVALAYPSTAVFVPALPPAFPDVLTVVLVGLAIVLATFVLGVGSLADTWKKGVAAGVALGLVLAGGAAFAAYQAGIPNLTATTTPEPGTGWEKAANALWTSGGLPVVFFYGSQACPYCSASSWAIYEALLPFGSWSGTGYAASSPTDVYPNTPEVALSGSALSSSTLAWDPHEDSNTQMITDPAVSPVEQAYVSTYDSSRDIPFFVVGGIYIHTGTIVSPAALQGQSAQSVVQSLAAANPSDPVYTAIHQQVVYLEAYCWKILVQAGLTPPSSVTGNSEIQSVYAQIS